jgi:hypothetical protein
MCDQVSEWLEELKRLRAVELRRLKRKHKTGGVVHASHKRRVTTNKRKA